MTDDVIITYECMGGWTPLINSTIEKMLAVCPQTVFHQIKEKFGGLRIYWSAEGCDDQETINNLVAISSDAELASYLICEVCGSLRDIGITDKGWVQTVCHSCLLKKPHVPSWHRRVYFHKINDLSVFSYKYGVVEIDSTICLYDKVTGRIETYFQKKPIYTKWYKTKTFLVAGPKPNRSKRKAFGLRIKKCLA